ncbi:MAG: DUF2306 domain-containing protein [Neomegalonema sp.]|nr:DUF2306 domain-containing protein [Neomegalonema sp.]
MVLADPCGDICRVVPGRQGNEGPSPLTGFLYMVPLLSKVPFLSVFPILSMAPLWEAGPMIFTHTIAAMLAIVIGAVQLLARKGGARHHLLGWIWVAAMAWVAVSSMFIHGYKTWGLWSPIHLLSLVALAMLILGVHRARRGQVERHRLIMQLLYWLGLMTAGLLTLLPGRVMHAVLFGAS